MQFPATSLAAVSATHESRKDNITAQEQGGLGEGIGQMFAHFDLSEATYEF